MNKRPGHVNVTVETGYCNFCGRARNLRREEHQLGTLVRTIITCETCHRTLSSSVGVAAVEPEAAEAQAATQVAAEAQAETNVKSPAPAKAPARAKAAAKPKAPPRTASRPKAAAPKPAASRAKTETPAKRATTKKK